MGEPKVAPQLVRVITLAHVLPDGLRVTGVALEYDRKFPAVSVPPDAFEVNFTAHAGYSDALTDRSRRTVVRGYSASRPDFAPEPVAGNYLVLELDPDDENASGTWTDGRYTVVHDLSDVLLITQLEPVPLAGEVLQPAPGVTHTSTDSRRLVADDYTSDAYRARNGITVPYRLFSPGTTAKVPLVITLHGHGESGNDNLAQIVGNQLSTAFADPDRQQEQPAFVLSPQTEQGAVDGSDGAGWWNPRWQQAVIELIDQLLDSESQIDRDRVYLAGVSMGAYGSWEILPAQPEVFAGALLVCGAGREEHVTARLGSLPVWALHSEDDEVVPYDAPGSDDRIFRALETSGRPVTWSIWDGDADLSEQVTAAEAAVSEARTSNSCHIFTTFRARTTPGGAHHSWVPTFQNPVILDWLFSQNRSLRKP